MHNFLPEHSVRNGATMGNRHNHFVVESNIGSDIYESNFADKYLE